jgi:thioredoxin 1
MITEVDNMEAVKDGDVLLDFYSTTYKPCQALNPVLEEISQEFKSVKVAKVEVTKNPEMTQRFGIFSVPVIVFMKNSHVKGVARGVINKTAITTMVREHFRG